MSHPAHSLSVRSDTPGRPSVRPSGRPAGRPAGQPAGRPAYYYYYYYYCYYYYTLSDPAHNLSDPANTRQIVKPGTQSQGGRPSIP